MMIIADVNWDTVMASAGAVLTAVGAAVAGMLKLFLGHLDKREEKQQVHETGIMDRVEKLGERFDVAVRDFRVEQRETIKTLLDIQGETVKAVGILSQKVGELGIAINELRIEVGHKADRPDRTRGPRDVT